MTDEKIRLLFEKCPRDKANDKKLPSDSFVVSYNDKEELKRELKNLFPHVDDNLIYKAMVDAKLRESAKRKLKKRRKSRRKSHKKSHKKRGSKKRRKSRRKRKTKRRRR